MITTKEPTTEFATKLENLLNECSMENGSDTPDFILAQFLRSQLEIWNDMVRARDKWFGFVPFSRCHENEIDGTEEPRG